MANLDILPKTNLKLTDIRDTLNAHGGKCDNEMGSLFSPLAAINHWSFYKPYATDLNLFKLTDDQIRSSDVNCGFTVFQIAAPSSLPNVMDGNMNGWVYNLPTGGQYSPFRTGDYLGYFPEALPMIRDLQVPAQISIQETEAISITAVVGIQDGKSVTLADLGGLSDCYGAVYMVHGTLNQTRIIEGTGLLSGGSFNVEVPMSEFLEGEWTIYPYITNGMTNFTVPNLNSKKVSVINSVVVARVVAMKSTDGSYSISWEVRVTNKSSQPITFNGNNVKLRYSGNGRTDTMQEFEKITYLDDGLVASGSTTTTIASGVFENVSTIAKEWDDGVVTSLWNSPIIWVELNDAAYFGSGVPLSMIE